MQEIAFKVSAKAARLIGRESVSNAEGALAELIKNTYDADASACAICLVKRFHELPNLLSQIDYEWLLAKESKFSTYFEQKKSDFILTSETISADDQALLDSALSKLSDLWIIDNGTGMSADIIKQSWMVIGTEYKEENIISDGGRTRTGAKGIGRFALDRLGATCDLYSFTEDHGAIKWSVNWGNFDGSGKTLDQVKAVFGPVENAISEAWKHPTSKRIKHDVENSHFTTKKTGTFIRISHLRDNWDERLISKIERSMSALVPPAEQSPLKLFLLHSDLKPSYEQVTPALLEDFDYRLDASFNKDGVTFRFQRNELVAHEIDLKVFEREDMKRDHFSLDEFKSQSIEYSLSIEELFGELSEEEISEYQDVGEFDFSLLFFKRAMPGGADRKIYPYRSFRGAERKSWLDEYGGIKIYRDNFAVRPYGEIGSRAFDWLGLGQRVNQNPAAASRKGWRVGPHNLAGTISISRIDNPNLYDQVTREGLIENDVFRAFKSLLLRIIQEFEDDRSHIHFNINENHKAENKPAQKISKGAEAASRLLKNPETATKEDTKSLAEAVIAQSEEITELKEEQAMMRSLATLGTVLVSFSHEMGQLQSTMGSRSSELMGILDSYIGPDDFGDDRPLFHPYSILEDWAEDDQKVKQWFNFALSSVKANKRRRNWVDLKDYIVSARENWRGFLEPRKITLELIFEDDYEPEILAFPIDLESIFNNLLINSVEALTSRNHSGTRKVFINIGKEADQTVRITYSDNGPGISKSIKPPSKIFDYNVTTKRDTDGQPIGTGLGMWILDTIVQEYGGTAKAFRPSETSGFKIQIFLPCRLAQ